MREDGGIIQQSRTIWRYLNSNSNLVGNIRHTIEHIEKGITKGDKEKSGPVALWPSKDASSVQIYDYNITTAAIASILGKLHKIALEICVLGYGK